MKAQIVCILQYNGIVQSDGNRKYYVWQTKMTLKEKWNPGFMAYDSNVLPNSLIVSEKVLTLSTNL